MTSLLTQSIKRAAPRVRCYMPRCSLGQTSDRTPTHTKQSLRTLATAAAPTAPAAKPEQIKNFQIYRWVSVFIMLLPPRCCLSLSSCGSPIFEGGQLGRERSSRPRSSSRVWGSFTHMCSDFAHPFFSPLTYRTPTHRQRSLTCRLTRSTCQSAVQWFSTQS